MENPKKIKVSTTAAALSRRYGLTIQRVFQLRNEGKLTAICRGGAWTFDQEQADQFFQGRAARMLEKIDSLYESMQLDKPPATFARETQPDIRRGRIEDIIRLGKEHGEKILYDEARSWLVLGTIKKLGVDAYGFFLCDLDEVERFFRDRKRKRETAIKVAEAEREAAWPATQSIEQLADALNLHSSWVRSAASFGLLPAAGATPSGDPYFEFPYWKMLELRDRRNELVGAVNQADEAAEEAAKKKRRESDAAAERTDQEKRARIEKEHLRLDRIAGRR